MIYGQRHYDGSNCVRSFCGDLITFLVNELQTVTLQPACMQPYTMAFACMLQH